MESSSTLAVIPFPPRGAELDWRSSVTPFDAVWAILLFGTLSASPSDKLPRESCTLLELEPVSRSCEHPGSRS